MFWSLLASEDSRGSPGLGWDAYTDTDFHIFLKFFIQIDNTGKVDLENKAIKYQNVQYSGICFQQL